MTEKEIILKIKETFKGFKTTFMRDDKVLKLIRIDKPLKSGRLTSNNGAYREEDIFYLIHVDFDKKYGIYLLNSIPVYHEDIDITCQQLKAEFFIKYESFLHIDAGVLELILKLNTNSARRINEKIPFSILNNCKIKISYEKGTDKKIIDESFNIAKETLKKYFKIIETGKPKMSIGTTEAVINIEIPFKAYIK